MLSIIRKLYLYIFRFAMVLSLSACSLEDRITEDPEDAEFSGEQQVRVKNARERKRMVEYIEKNNLSNTAIKSFESNEGSIVDCVPTDSQPSITRAAERGVFIDTKITPPKGPFEEDKLIPDEMNGITDECNSGTIPIRRLTIDRLERFETLDDFLVGKAPLGILFPQPKTKYVYGGTYIDINSPVNESITALRSTLSVHQPETEYRDHSLSQIGVLRGGHAVEAGWRVEHLYAPEKTRGRPHFFIYFTTNSYNSGCYNLDCEGFVQTNSSFVLGELNWDVSGVPYKILKVSLVLEKDLGWWVYIHNEPLGFYPASLFPTNESGNGIISGGQVEGVAQGEVFNDPDGPQATTTDMGSGTFPSTENTIPAFQTGLRVKTDINDVWKAPSGPNLIAPSNTYFEKCYEIKLIDPLDIEYSPSTFEYGGPGYSDICEEYSDD